jgi:hypothetical protein
MSRRAAGALVALAALLLVVALWRQLAGRSRPAGAEAGAPETAAEAPVEIELVRRSATLWLPGPAGRIGPLAVDVESAPELGAQLDALLAALLAAKPEGELAALFPEPAVSVATMVGPEGVVYVDLRGAEGAEPPGAGSTLELQRVYSIVHTVLRNEPSLGGVVLLWNGVQRASLSGHVDTTRPLVLRPELESR